MPNRIESQIPHVHVHAYQRDCDGPHEHHVTQRATASDWESAIYCGPTLTANDVVRYMLDRAIGGAVGTYTSGRWFVDVDEGTEPDDVITVTVSHEPTEHDEGPSSVTFVGCTDADCADEGSYQRDAYAEAMGY